MSRPEDLKYIKRCRWSIRDVSSDCDDAHDGIVGRFHCSFSLKNLRTSALVTTSNTSCCIQSECPTCRGLRSLQRMWLWPRRLSKTMRLWAKVGKNKAIQVRFHEMTTFLYLWQTSNLTANLIVRKGRALSTAHSQQSCWVSRSKPDTQPTKPQQKGVQSRESIQEEDCPARSCSLGCLKKKASTRWSRGGKYCHERCRIRHSYQERKTTSLQRASPTCSLREWSPQKGLTNVQCLAARILQIRLRDGNLKLGATFSDKGIVPTSMKRGAISQRSPLRKVCVNSRSRALATYVEGLSSRLNRQGI